MVNIRSIAAVFCDQSNVAPQCRFSEGTDLRKFSKFLEKVNPPLLITIFVRNILKVFDLAAVSMRKALYRCCVGALRNLTLDTT